MRTNVWCGTTELHAWAGPRSVTYYDAPPPEEFKQYAELRDDADWG